MAELRLSSERRDGALIVTVTGELDIVTCRQLGEYLKDERGTSGAVILNLAGVTFMDTHALALIVQHWRDLASAGRELVLAEAKYQFTRTLWITGLARRLPMYDTVAEAITAVSQPPA